MVPTCRIALWVLAGVAILSPAAARTRPVNCGLVCDTDIPCGRHLQPICTSGAACDPGFVQFNLHTPYTYECPGFPCSGATLQFTAGCYDPLRPPTCAECGAVGQFNCDPGLGLNCGGLCDAGLTPNASGFCVLCGSEGEPICEDGDPACEGSLVIAGGECWNDCGGAGQLVCPNGACQDWHFSTLGICAACGGDPNSIPGTQAICPNSPYCRPNVEQQGLVCVNCGQNQEPECALGDACRDGAAPIGEDSGGNRICAFCGGPGELACESPACDAGLRHVTDAGLDGDIRECLEDRSAEEQHFIVQNGFCWNDSPESMARPAPESWPAAEEPSAARDTVFVLHGRGGSCDAGRDRMLDDGGLYDTGHLIYCVEYAQENVAGIDRRDVRILPVKDDLLGNPSPACTETVPPSCEFDETQLAAVVQASTFDVPGVASALATAILTVPTVNEITLVAHSQGGFIARELVYRHYDELRWAGKKINRVVTLAHPHYAKQTDPHLYTPWLCAANDNFDCATGKWVWGWDLGAPGSIDNDDYPQIEWTAVSGDSAGPYADCAAQNPPIPPESCSTTTLDEAVNHPDDPPGGAVNQEDEQCLVVFGGIPQVTVVGDSSVPIESSLGYDEWGYFAVSNLSFDREYHAPCTHNAACLLHEPNVDPVPCQAGSGPGSPVDTCYGKDAQPSIVPFIADPRRPFDALDFDGVDDRVVIDAPGAAAAAEADGFLTITAWIYPQGQGDPGGGGAIVNKEGEYWLARWGDGRLAFAVADGTWVARVSNTVAPLDTWTHVAFVFDGGGSGTARLYVNGREVQQWTVGPAIGDVNAFDMPELGGRSTTSQPFDGWIDDVRIWTRALTRDEVVAGMGDEPGPSTPAGLVGWWRFDESGDTLVDDSGNGFDASLSGLGPAATPLRQRTQRRERAGGALYFDGVDDRVVVDHPGALAGLAMSDEMTLEGWLFLRSYDSATMMVTKEGEYWLATSPTGQVGWAVASLVPGWVGVYSSYQVPLRTWTHVAFVWQNDPTTDTGTARLYVNGALEQEWAIRGDVGDANVGDDRLGIGGRAGGGQNVHGVIDEVRVWNVARSAADIAASWYRTVDPSVETGLVGMWQFDENTGDVTFDSSGNGRHGVLGGGTPGFRPLRTMAPHLPGFSLLDPARCGNGYVDPLESCDDAGATGGDGCSQGCRVERALDVQGTPQGGSVSIEVDGVTIVVATTAGQSADDVAAALAAAIAADPTLARLGVTATSTGARLLVGGAIENVVITDPGLMDCSATLAFPSIDGEVMNHCPDTAVLLSTVAGLAEYQWYRDDLPIVGANGPTYVATATGAYRVTVGDGLGCSRDSFDATTFVTFCPESEVSPPGAVFPLRLVKDPASPTGLYLYAQALDGVDGYQVYEGTLGTWYDHGATASCGLTACAAPNDVGCYDDLGTGEIRIAVAPGTGDRYLLATAYGNGAEGPTGRDSSGAPRDPGQSTCPP